MPTYDRVEFRVYTPLVSVVVLIAIALLMSLSRFAHDVDEAAVLREERQVDSGLVAEMSGASRPVDAAVVRRVGERYLLPDLRLDPSLTPKGGEARVLFKGHGQPPAMLAWTPDRPGARMLAVVVAPVLGGLFTLSLFALNLLRRGRKTTEGLMASEARAKHMALHDALTGLANRTLFAERIAFAAERLRRHGGAFAILSIDLDRFKEVNDTFGHLSGDELIREAAKRLTSVTRQGDTVARLGGDEFAIIANDATPQGAAALGRRLIDTVRGAVELPGGRVQLACSVGVTLVGDAELDPAEAMRQADLALYRAKAEGRGRFAFFEPEMDAALKARKALETDLRDAIANGALTMVYQPQATSRGAIFGVEALARWSHPERGPIPPTYFVSLAEECGLIDDLSAFTLRQAFHDSHRWPGLKVAVNLSAHQLRRPDFLLLVQRLLKDTGADARHFELEITEGVLLGDDAATHMTLRQLRDLGFTLALDDFGAGYSTLGHLRRYPVDKIKIDRSFVSGLGVDPDADQLVRAIVKLARALDLSIIAEGVETPEQRRRLSAAGCTRIQGFLFSKPVSADEIDHMVRQETSAAA